MVTYTANGSEVIRRALEEAGMKFDNMDSLGASADRLRAFCINPQVAFETWRKDSEAASTQSTSAANSKAGGEHA